MPTITDLTGYTWVGDVDLTSGFEPTMEYEFSLTFTCNGNTYSTFDVDGIDIGPTGGEGLLYYNNTGVYSTDDGWRNEAYRTIVITGGTDATNTDLIAWLEANGTLTAREPTATLDLSTLGLAVGTHTITVKAVASGYADSPDSNIVEYVVAPSGYNVTVSGTFNYGTGSINSSSIEIDGFTCSVDSSGSTTNVPHTFNNVTTFSVLPMSLSEIAYIKIISGAGTYIDAGGTGSIENNLILWGIYENPIQITATSNIELQLGYDAD